MDPMTINKEKVLSKKMDSSKEDEDDKKPPSYNTNLKEYKIATNDRLDSMETSINLMSQQFNIIMKQLSGVMKHLNIDLDNLDLENKAKDVINNDGFNTPDEVILADGTKLMETFKPTKKKATSVLDKSSRRSDIGKDNLDLRRGSIAFADTHGFKSPFEDKPKVNNEKDIRINRKECTEVLPDKFKAVDLWKFFEAVKLWEVKNKQSAHLQAIMTDNIRARIESVLTTANRHVFQGEEEILTSIEHTTNYSNAQWEIVLREVALPLTHRDYILQFQAISTVVQNGIAGGEGKSAWRNGTLYINNIKTAYEDTKAYLAKAGGIVLFLTADEDVNTIDRLQNIPPLFNMVHNSSYTAFGTLFLKQLSFFGDEMQQSNEFLTWMFENLRSSHLDFIYYVIKWFEDKFYTPYKGMYKGFNLLVDRNIKLSYKEKHDKLNVMIDASDMMDYDGDDYDQLSELMGHVDDDELDTKRINAVATTSPFKKADFPSGSFKTAQATPSKHLVKSDLSGACFAAIYNKGVCPKLNCKFSHDINVLDKASKESVTKLKEFRTAKSLPSFNNISHDEYEHHEQQLPLSCQRKEGIEYVDNINKEVALEIVKERDKSKKVVSFHQSVGYVDDEDDGDSNSVDYDTDVEFDGKLNALLDNNQAASIIATKFHISLFNDNGAVITNKCLLDSGNFARDYMSEDLADQIVEQGLANFAPSRHRMKLADGVTTCLCTKKIVMDCYALLPDSDEKVHVNLHLYIHNSGEDVIISLYSILQQFYLLFILHLNKMKALFNKLNLNNDDGVADDNIILSNNLFSPLYPRPNNLYLTSVFNINEDAEDSDDEQCDDFLIKDSNYIGTMFNSKLISHKDTNAEEEEQEEGKDIMTDRAALNCLLASVPSLNNTTFEEEFKDASPNLNNTTIDDKILEDLLAAIPVEPKSIKSNDSEQTISDKEEDLQNYLDFVDTTWKKIQERTNTDPDYATQFKHNILPWSITKEKQIAAEESGEWDPNTSDMNKVLLYMETVAMDERIADFNKYMIQNVDPQMVKDTDILELLQKFQDVFIPVEWMGIKMDPIHINTSDDMPDEIRSRATFINPNLMEATKKEFERLMTYMYRDSNSSITSPLVIASKNGPPWIRIAVDYRIINKYILLGQPTPIIPKNELDRLMNAGFVVFAQFDATNAFHQLPIDEETGEILSIRTPYGQFAPKFLPEGVSPASFLLQEAMRDIFKGMDDFVLVIADNLVVCGTDNANLYSNIERMLTRARERNLVLKMAKSFVGQEEQEFWGYNISKTGFDVTDKRKQGVQDFVFPDDKLATKEKVRLMQSFLGVSLVYKDFIHNYSTLVSKLNDMTHKSFDWNVTTWKHNYKDEFLKVKLAVLEQTKIFWPDYSLDWELSVDASDIGAGAFLSQLRKHGPVDSEGNEDKSQRIIEPIGYRSIKFSSTARAWSVIEKEGFSIFFGVKCFDFYLRGKEFKIKTDHRNLLWMELSTVAKIIRWRLFLQTFSFTIEHIAGKVNYVPDALSRLLHIVKDKYINNVKVNEDIYTIPVFQSINYGNFNNINLTTTDIQVPKDTHTRNDRRHYDNIYLLRNEGNTTDVINNVTATADPVTAKQLIESVHGKNSGKRKGHLSIRDTWIKLKEKYPNNQISQKEIRDFVFECGTCSKVKNHDHSSSIPEVKLSLNNENSHARSLIGVDTLKISPPTNDGFKAIIIVVNIFTGFTLLHAVKDMEAETMAGVLLRIATTFGTFDKISSDPGSDLTSDAVESLMKYLGSEHKVSLVKRHESNGCEQRGKEILKHLRALVIDERCIERWADDKFLLFVQHLCNNQVDQHTKLTYFENQHGRASAIYSRIPNTDDPNVFKNKYIKALEVERSLVNKLLQEKWKKINHKRKSSSDPASSLNFQPGDYVLYITTGAENDHIRAGNKLIPIFLGPYLVLSHNKNDVQIKHIVMSTIRTEHVTNLKHYWGSLEDATTLAQADYNQYNINKIINYKGDPNLRTSLQFLVLFVNDNTPRWLLFNRDLTETVQFEIFVKERSELLYLLHIKTQEIKLKKMLRVQPILDVKPGDTIYVILAVYGYGWYENLKLPFTDDKVYVVKMIYKKWLHNNKKSISVACPVYGNEPFDVNNEWVQLYGLHQKLKNYMIEVTPSLLIQFPRMNF